MESHVYEQLNELENQHWWFKARRTYLGKIISGLFTKEKADRAHEFIEIGCGTGGNLPLLCQFADVDAIEMNDSARERVKSKNIEGLRHLNAGYLPDNINLSLIHI